MQIYKFICSYIIILSVQYQWHNKWLMDAFGFRKACGDPQGGNGRDIQSQWDSWPSSSSSKRSCHPSQPLDYGWFKSGSFFLVLCPLGSTSCLFMQVDILHPTLWLLLYAVLLCCISSALDSITSSELDVVPKPLKQTFFFNYLVIYIWYWVILISNIWSVVVVSTLISQHPSDAFTNVLYLLSIYKDLWLQ